MIPNNVVLVAVLATLLQGMQERISGLFINQRCKNNVPYGKQSQGALHNVEISSTLGVMFAANFEQEMTHCLSSSSFVSPILCI